MLTSIRAALAITLAALPGFVLGQPSDIPVVTVCEVMKELPAYNGKTIVVVGRFGSTDEGAWLSEDCTQQLVIKGHEWSNSISLSDTVGSTQPPPSLPKAFRWNKNMLFKKLTQVKSTTVLRVYPEFHYSDKWLALYGRLETHVPLETLDGFGHLNGSPAQLISPQDGVYRFSGGNRKAR